MAVASGLKTATYTFAAKTWLPVVVGSPSLLRLLGTAETTPVYNFGTVYYAPESIPNSTSDAYRAINGDCYLSAPGIWYIYVDTNGAYASKSFSGLLLDLYGTLYGDFGHVGGGVKTQSAALAITSANTAQKLLDSNSYRKAITVVNWGPANLNIRFDPSVSADFGTANISTTTYHQDGIPCPAVTVTNISGDFLTYGQVWGMSNGTPNLFIVEYSN